MAWYKDGTISVTNNSNIVNGTGTLFTSAVLRGEAVVMPNGVLYEIDEILTATQLRLAKAYTGPTAAGQAYSIAPIQDYLKILANQAAQLLSGYATSVDKLAGIEVGATKNQTDAYLLARANHTGTQAQSTVANLVADLADRPATSTLGTTAPLRRSDSRFVTLPRGGSYTAEAAVTGAFKIALPHMGAVMVKFTLSIFEYAVDTSIDLEISGYAFTNGTWINTSAAYKSQTVSGKQPTVRFGHDGVTNCIWVGELTDVWQYPKVQIHSLTCGYNNLAITAAGEWPVTLATAFGTVNPLTRTPSKPSYTDRAETISAQKTFSAPVLLPDGTAAAPGMAFALTPSLGFRRAGATTLSMCAGNAEHYAFTPTALVGLNEQIFESRSTNAASMRMSSPFGVAYRVAGTGTWARGFVINEDVAGATVAGAGFLGTGSILTRYAIGFNNSWWASYAFAVGAAEAQFNVPTRWLNGTVAAPSISFANSTTSGLYWEQGVGLGFSVSGIRKMLMGSASVIFGAVGVGAVNLAGVSQSVHIRGAEYASSSLGISNTGENGLGASLFFGKDRAGAIPQVADRISEIYHTAYNGISYANVQQEILRITAIAGSTVTVNSERSVNGVLVEATSAQNKAFSVPVSVAQGIKFPAAQFLSADSNTLDDYEEGSFTAQLVGSTSGSVALPGSYVKVGTIVHLHIRFLATIAANALVGNLSITGLPFTTYNPNSSVYQDVGLIHIRAAAPTGLAGAAWGTIVSNSTTIRLHTTANYNSSLIYADQPATYPAANLPQNGSSTVYICFGLTLLTA